jgi:hypothetical protein
MDTSLGEFDEVNAFCTVRFTLTEYTEYLSSRSFLSYCKKAFFMATALWAAGLALLLLLCVTSGSILWAADKFGIVRKIVDDAEKKVFDPFGKKKPCLKLDFFVLVSKMFCGKIFTASD